MSIITLLNVHMERTEFGKLTNQAAGMGFLHA